MQAAGALLIAWMMFDPTDPGSLTDTAPSPQDQLQIEDDTVDSGTQTLYPEASTDP